MAKRTEELIATKAAAEAALARITAARTLVVDLEFERRNTFWPIACLIQVGMLSDDGRNIADEDVLLFDALRLPKATTRQVVQALLPRHLVVFSAVQDLYLLRALGGAWPNTITDMQHAAPWWMGKVQPSLSVMAAGILKLDMSKAAQTSDWRARPLSNTQLAYARADITVVAALYQALRADKNKPGAEHALNEDSADTLWHAKKLWQEDHVLPAAAWQKFVAAKRMNTAQRRFLYAACCWRLHEAKRRNIPVPWVLRNDALERLAWNAPFHDRHDRVDNTNNPESGQNAPHRAPRLNIKARATVAAILDHMAACPEVSLEYPAITTPPLTDAVRANFAEACAKAGLAPAQVVGKRELAKFVAAALAYGATTRAPRHASGGAPNQATEGSAPSSTLARGWRYWLIGRYVLIRHSGERQNLDETASAH